MRATNQAQAFLSNQVRAILVVWIRTAGQDRHTGRRVSDTASFQSYLLSSESSAFSRLPIQNIHCCRSHASVTPELPLLHHLRPRSPRHLRRRAIRLHPRQAHINATVGPCQCAASQWQKMPKSGLWMQAISPYDHRILDFRMPTDPSRSVVVSTEEEFLLHRVVFLVLGLVLMVVAQTLSESVVFYYGGAMTIGIFLVILIILFQGMKLLPTGRKSSLAIFTYSSLVGMTTYFLHYLSGMLRSVLVEIGIAEDMHNPLGIFVLVSVILAGAWFGYWGVRKFVLAEDGSVDEGVAYFVEWAILIVSAVMILQSSLDYLFAFTTLVLCGIIKVIARIEGKSKVLRYIFGGLSDGTSRNSSRYGDFDEDYSSMNEDRQDGFGNLHGGYQRHAPRRNSPLAGSAKTLSQGVAMDSFYSTFHTTPERMEFTKEEYEAFTRKETKKAMKQLLSSPDFNRWALANADRISVAPPGGSYSSNNSQQRHRFLGLF
uniref:Uncharacterized protein n=1 Tax=Zea mays TaxID=4577 RepID=A0A804RE73_MAIZE